MLDNNCIDKQPRWHSPSLPNIFNLAPSKIKVGAVLTVSVVALAIFAGMRAAAWGALAIAAGAVAHTLYHRWRHADKSSKESTIPSPPSPKSSSLTDQQQEKLKKQQPPPPADITWIKNFNAELPNDACWMEVALFQIAAEFMDNIEGGPPSFTPAEVARIKSPDFSENILGILKEEADRTEEKKEVAGLLRKLLIQTLLNIKQSKSHPTLIKVSEGLSRDFFELFVSAFFEINPEFGIQQKDSNEALEFMRSLINPDQSENLLRGKVHEIVGYQLLTDKKDAMISELDYDPDLRNKKLTAEQFEETVKEMVSDYVQRTDLLKQKECEKNSEAVTYNFPGKISDEEVLQERIFKDVKNEEIYSNVSGPEDRGTGYVIPLLQTTTIKMHQPPRHISFEASPRRIHTTRAKSYDKQVTYGRQIVLEKQNIAFNPIITCTNNGKQYEYEMTSCIVNQTNAKKTVFEKNEWNAAPNAGHYYAFFKVNGYWYCMSAGRIAQQPELVHQDGKIPSSPMTDEQFFDYLNNRCQQVVANPGTFEWRNIKASYALKAA